MHSPFVLIKNIEKKYQKLSMNFEIKGCNYLNKVTLNDIDVLSEATKVARFNFWSINTTINIIDEKSV